MSGGPSIPNKKSNLPVAPTPQNTPLNNAPINSRAQAPGLGSLKEEDVDRAAAASLLAKNPQLVNLIQNRLSGLVGQSSGYIESLPLNVRRRIAGLKSVQSEHSKLEAQFQEEVLELEKKYLAKYTPLYQKRADIVNGKSEPTEQEIKDGAQEEDEDEGKPAISIDKTEDEDDTPMTGVPEFWLTAMKNQPNLAEMITDNDEIALRTLTDIRMEYLDKPGFKLVFSFAENEFFSNQTISKSYFYQEENGYGGDFIYDHAEGDKIDWKAGKDLTVKIESKKQRNKNTKQTRIVKKTVPADSFFNFFSPPNPPTDDDEPEDDIEDRLELDYTIGEEIKEKLIPRAIDWFTGEALQHEGFEPIDEREFEDDDDLDDEDLSDDRDDDDDEDESDDDGEGRRSAKPDTTECKQS